MIFGHSHQAQDLTLDGIRLFNPGTAGGVRYSPTVGILTIEGGQMRLEHVALRR